MPTEMTNTTAHSQPTIIPALRTIEGEGFHVRRAIPVGRLEAVGPFIFLDHFGPIDIRPGEAKGAPEHPHAGIETLSYLLEGRSQHKDGLGNVSSMGPGEVQWMRAGRGLIHDERPDAELNRRGGRLHGFQFWINMPRGHKHDEPAYRHYGADAVPSIAQGNVRLKVIAGEIGGLRGPVETFGSPFLAHLCLEPGSTLTLDLPGPEAALYVAVGSVRIDTQDTSLPEGMLALLSGRSSVSVSADEASDVLLLGGAPLDAPIVRHGPFVMNEMEEIRTALRDYSAGRMGSLVAG